MNRTLVPAACGLLLLASAACDGPREVLAPEPGALQPLFASAAGPAGAGSGSFHFLPPMAPNPEDRGPADGEARPVVEVCSDPACEAPHARFTSEGSGPERVRHDPDDGHFIVNWSPATTGAEAGAVYTIRVLESGSLLGQIEVFVVSTGREAVALRADGSVAVLHAQTLPIRFHVGTTEGSTDRWLNGTGDPSEFDFVVLQFPASITVSAGGALPQIFGRALQLGLTDTQLVASDRIRAEVGLGPAGSDPRSDPSWQWFPAEFVVVDGSTHEYGSGVIPTPAPGTYSYTYRFELDGEGFTLADLDGAGKVFGGFPFDPGRLGTLTVTP